tara:strand:+ start:4790 stop:5323 length:534 start_codon:yes stop_codon:yes gene_type:complete
MTRNFSDVKPSDSLHKASKLMINKKINNLLVTNGKKLLGIITARDILWAVTKKPSINLKDLTVMEIATKKIAVIKPSADISQAIHKMKQTGFRRLPVLTKGNISGIITLKDVLKIDPTLYSHLGQLAEIKEESLKLKKLEHQEDYETEGLCETCDAFSTLLKVQGQLLCLDCRNELY